MTTDPNPNESLIKAARTDVLRAGKGVIDLSVEADFRGHEALTKTEVPAQDIPRIPYDHSAVEVATLASDSSAEVSPSEVLSVSARIAQELIGLRDAA